MPPRKANQAPPDFFFQVLKKSVQNATRDDPFGIKLVDRSKKSLYFSQMNIPRAQRPPYIMTKRLFCCFLDIPLANAVYILGVSERVMRKLRTWCGVTRWPRNDIVQQKVVLRERLKLMEEICESDPYGYEMLYRVHQTAGYDMSPLPNPRDFDADVPDNRQKQIEAVKAALEGPPADYKTVCQDFPQAAQVAYPLVDRGPPRALPALGVEEKVPLGGHVLGQIFRAQAAHERQPGPDVGLVDHVEVERLCGELRGGRAHLLVPRDFLKARHEKRHGLRLLKLKELDLA